MGAPTLIVGIGGIGGNVVQLLSDRIKNEGVTNVELLVMDTDVNDLRQTKEKYPNIYTVQTSPPGTVGKALDHNRFALERWFPVNDGLTGKPFTEGAGQVRAVSRLAFDHAVEQGLMEDLEKAIAKLHGLTGDVLRQEMRIVIVGSIAGGTGSGLVLPAAMYIRNFLITRYQDNSAIIRGFFLEPDVVFGRLIDESERNTQRANAYAALRELNAFFRKEHSGESSQYRHIVFNAPQPGLGDRVDYPNILPYNYVFLMDALNEKGDSFTDDSGRPDLEAYKKHAADCVYAMSLSPVASRTNSGEDNMIRRIAASGGMSRYCGAGSSCLEYPKEKVQLYIALNWAKHNISDEWLEIDTEYEDRARQQPDLKLSRFYRDAYKGKCDSGTSFYKDIKNQSEIKGQDGEVIDRVEEFLDSLKVHAHSWAEKDLYNLSTTLKRARYDDRDNERLKPLLTDAEAILEYCKQAGNAAGLMQLRISSFWNFGRAYSRAATEEVADLATGAARSAFEVSEYEENPLEHRDKDWQIEHIFRIANEDGTIGSFHPAAVRNLLYCVIDELEQEKKDAEENAETAKKNMIKAEEDDYYDGNNDRDDPIAAVALIFSAGTGGRGRQPLPFLNPNEDIDPDKAEKLAIIGRKLNKYKKSIEEFVDAKVASAFYEHALKYARGLSSAYESFYKHMKNEIDGIDRQISAIENNPAFNEPKGSSHRYVCASKENLEVMKNRCFKNGSSGNLESELCGDIYQGLLQLARKGAGASSYGDRNEIARELLKDLFKKVVIDYWSNRVLDPRLGYPQIVDKSIIQAIADEAVYKKTEIDGDVFMDQASENAAAQDYIKRKLDEARLLSYAFIELPVDEAPRPIRSCAYSKDAFDNATAFADKTKRLLDNTYNGVEVDPREFSISKYKIRFFSALYGLRADNLPKYAPEHVGMENRPEGEYHRAYFEIVNQLSPNLKDNRLITPHIDKNWHLVSCLPDLNENHERKLKHNIVRAYLYSLIFRQLGSETVIDSDDMYYLKATEGRLRTRLWVSNGTPCDRFYEVFDALKFSPPAVTVLLESAEKRRQAERNRKLTLTIDNCDWLSNIKTRAFIDFDSDAFRKRILDGIADRQTALAHPSLQALVSRFPNGKMENAVVTNLFFFSSGENETYRNGFTSLFDIPLIYRLSLPHSETQEGEIDLMIESIFHTVEDYLGEFCDGNDLVASCCQLFEEQYLLFEWNLIGYDSVYPTLHTSQVVNSVREKAYSYLEDKGNYRAERIDAFQPTVQEAWKQFDAKN